jgi:5-methylcytosine-specific restriction endonuclease McrA
LSTDYKTPEYREYARERYKNNKEYREGQKERRRKNLREQRKIPEFSEERNRKQREYYWEHPEKRNCASERYRLKVITHYTDGTLYCTNCGLPIYDCLEIDHKNGDGAKHRVEVGSNSITAWIIANDFPDGFQILCATCHRLKTKRGELPSRDELIEAYKKSLEFLEV